MSKKRDGQSQGVCRWYLLKLNEIVMISDGETYPAMDEHTNGCGGSSRQLQPYRVKHREYKRAANNR